MTITVNDVLQVTAKMRLYAAIDVMNVYHYQVKVVNSTDLNDVVMDFGEVMENVYNPILTHLTNKLTFSEIQVYNKTQDEPYGAIPWPNLTAGLSVADPLVTGAAFLIRLLVHEKRGQGRKFLGGAIENSVTEGLFNANFLEDASGSVIAIMESPIGSESGNHYNPVVFNRVTQIGMEIYGAVMEAVPAYQRRRKFGSGS